MYGVGNAQIDFFAAMMVVSQILTEVNSAAVAADSFARQYLADGTCAGTRHGLAGFG
jgi:hypothetical protein